MNGLARYVGRGLLLVALSGVVGGCGDDDDDASGGNDGGEAGRGGSGGRGSSGSGGRDAGGSGITPEQCADDAVQSVGAACLACVCEIDPEETVACRATCWDLVTCVATRCDGDGSDVDCVNGECGEFLGGASQASTFGLVFDQCSEICTSSSVVDAGSDSDAGN